MKTKWLFIGAFLALASLTACGDTTDLTVVPLTFGKLYDASLSIEEQTEELSLLELGTLVSRESNALIWFTPSDTDCVCYSQFGASLSSYLKKHNALVYRHTIVDEGAAMYAKMGLTLSAYSSAFAILKDGEVAHFFDSEESDVWQSASDLSSYLKERVHDAPMLYINLDQLSALQEGDLEFTVGYLRHNCSDCAYLSTHFLKSYNEEDSPNPIYLVKCDQEGILYNDGIPDWDQWQAFKDKVGMSDALNTVYGYGEGYVPTFIHYQPGLDLAEAVIDMAVYLNDTVAPDGDDFVITSSYYDGDEAKAHQFLDGRNDLTTVLVGQKVSAEDVEAYEYVAEDGVHAGYYYKNEAAASYHDPLLKAFLDFYEGK